MIIQFSYKSLIYLHNHKSIKQSYKFGQTNLKMLWAPGSFVHRHDKKIPTSHSLITGYHYRITSQFFSGHWASIHDNMPSLLNSHYGMIQITCSSSSITRRPGPAFFQISLIHHDWSIGQSKVIITVLSKILSLQLQNFVLCGRDRPSEGLSPSHNTRFCNLRGQIVIKQSCPSLIHGSDWFSLIKSGPSHMTVNRPERN